MPYDIELLGPDNRPYKVAEHRFSYRWDEVTMFEGGRANRTDESRVQFSNMDDVWRFDCISPLHDDKTHEIVAWPEANAVNGLDDTWFEEEQYDVPAMLKQWAKDHPNGHWRAL